VIVIVEVNLHHRLPGLNQIVKTDMHNFFDDTQFSMSKFPTFNLGVNAAIAAEEVIHQNKYQFRIEHNQSGTA